MGEFTPGPWRYAEVWHPPFGKTEQTPDIDGNIFWGYSISGSDENGTPILPTLAAVHNFGDAIEANARLIAAAPDLFRELVDLRKRFHDACRSAGSDEEFVVGSTPGADAAIARATQGSDR